MAREQGRKSCLGVCVQGEEAPGEDTGETGTGPHNIELKAGFKSVKVVLYVEEIQ